jgi:hypothetical protein
MKKITLGISIMAITATISMFGSCKKGPSPTPEQTLEEYDASRIRFIKLNADGTETTDTTTVNFDRTGEPTPNQTYLSENTSYRTLITMLLRGNSVNQEIIDDGDIHQFFFLPEQTGIFEYAYGDTDKNGRGIGLDGTATITGVGTTTIKVVLRHGLDKSKPEAQSWDSKDYEKAGGEDDLNVVFQLQAQ